MFRLSGCSVHVDPRKWAVVLLLIAMLVTTGASSAIAYPAGPKTLLVATAADADTLDPALDYETSGGEVIQNIYETLVFYDGADASAFVPQLADSYSLSVDKLTWTFHIRPGVKFHNGASLTASDVAYSFQRGLLQGGSYSPQMLLAEPFFGVGIYDITTLIDPTGSLLDDRNALQTWPNPTALVTACNKVVNAIVADDVAGTVTMTLAQPWGPFLGTIAQPWGSIMDKDWVIAHGGWGGSCSNWQNWYATNSADDPFTAIANGTGPFKLDRWTKGQEIVLTRNSSYWRKPATLEHIEIQIVTDDATRFSMLQSGAADEARPVGNIATADTMVGEDCVWNLSTHQYDCTLVDAGKMLRRYIGRPSLSENHGLMNFEIAPDSTYIGSGLLDGSGIPVDFFSDVHIRKAFNYCFDWDTFGQTAYGGEFVQLFTLPLEGMPGYDPGAAHYTKNLAQCEAELGLADVDQDGIPSASDTNDVTQVGFYFKLPYNQGNLIRQTLAEILAANFALVAPKYQIAPISLILADYSDAQRNGRLPVLTGGWLEDIHDPHNWYQPFLVGTYASRAHLPDAMKTQFQTYINQGVSATDFTARHTIYQQLNQSIYDNAPLIILGSTTNHSFIQRRVSGRILNPIFPGNYYYTMHKGVNLISPADDVHLNNNRPTFDWVDFPGAIGYNIQISRNNTFTQLVSNTNLTGATNSIYTPTLNLTANANLYWRVRAKLTATTYSDWSEGRSLHTANPPSIPNLMSPANAALLATTSPVFDWSNSTIPTGTIFDHYQIQIATDAGFTTVIHDVNISGVTNSKDTSAVLPSGATYYWRVGSFNTMSDFSGWSAVRSVKIKYSAPLLLTPANGANAGSLLPTFTWNAVSGATNYTIEVSKSNQFLIKVINVTTASTNFTAITSLTPGTTYFWRVKVNGPYGPVYSTVFTFTTP